MARIAWTKKDGETLREARKAFGISQAQLGQAVGVTSSRICECERVDFPAGRHCSPGKELGAKILNHLSKLTTQAKKQAEKEANKAEAKPKAEAKVEEKAEAKAEEKVEATA